MLEDRCVHKGKIEKIFDSFQPDLVGISLMSGRTLKDALKVSKSAKKRGIYVSWGGALASMQPDILLKEDCIDSIIFSEGEYTFAELLEALQGKRSFDSVLGLFYKENGKMIKNKPRPFADLAEFPVSDYSLIDVKQYLQPYLGCKKMMYVYSSKGCPCKCAFCANPAFHFSCHRKRPNEKVIAEIKYLIENYGVDGVYFSDELWVSKRSDMLDFCRRVKEENLHFHFGIQVRIGMFSEEDFRLLYDCGCRWALFGIESGSKSRLDKIHKNIEYDKILPTFRYLHEIGITTVASYIIGFPQETEQEVKETCDLVQNVNANLSTVYHFSPLPGTELYDEVVNSGQYAPITALSQLSKNIATESLGKNLSAVPSKDLRVIKSYFNWKSFTKKDAIQSGKNFTFALQTILNGLGAITKKGIIMFFHDGFLALKEFLYVFWYSHAYPSIKKKYDLK